MNSLNREYFLLKYDSNELEKINEISLSIRIGKVTFDAFHDLKNLEILDLDLDLDPRSFSFK